jgi:hypothetical protein
MSVFDFIKNLFSSNPEMTFQEEVYAEAYMDDALGRPNPFISSAPVATQHHHIITILDFLRQDPHLHVWIPEDRHESVLDDTRFSLNNFVINHQ